MCGRTNPVLSGAVGCGVYSVDFVVHGMGEVGAIDAGSKVLCGVGGAIQPKLAVLFRVRNPRRMMSASRLLIVSCVHE